MKLKSFVLKYLHFAVALYTLFSNRERHTRYGSENPDKVFYIYGVPDTNGGLWWHINKVLMHLGYAKDKGYIPVVDMQNFESQYLEKESIGLINLWEVFFNQPGGYTLSDVSKSKNIILSKKAPSPSKKYCMGQSEFYNNEDRIQYFRGLFRQYVTFNTRTQNYLDGLYDMLFKGKGKIVGVLCRGTDYVVKKPKNHPIQPDPEDVIKDVADVMRVYGCNYVFLATEDADILDRFKLVFGNKLLYVDQKRIGKHEIANDSYIASVNMLNNKGLDTFAKGIGYLSATYLLSKCNCYIAGRTGGSKGVLIMTEGFDYMKIYDLGLY